MNDLPPPAPASAAGMVEVVVAVGDDTIDSAAESAVDGATDAATVKVVDPQRWARLAQAAFVACGVSHGRLDLSFVDAASMAELNRTHMHVEGPTDVLSFPIDAVDTFGAIDESTTLRLAPTTSSSLAAEAGPADGAFSRAPNGEMEDAQMPPVLLGDIVICVEMAQANARAADRSLDDELALLVVHGVLHVMGLDHLEPAERAHMQSRERELLVALHDPNASTDWAPATPARPAPGVRS